jgi:hypothetical protein
VTPTVNSAATSDPGTSAETIAARTADLRMGGLRRVSD